MLTAEIFLLLFDMSKELEDRFHNYAKAVRDFCTRVKWDIINKEYIKQVIRSSGSVSATIQKHPMTWEKQMRK